MLQSQTSSCSFFLSFLVAVTCIEPFCEQSVSLTLYKSQVLPIPNLHRTGIHNEQDIVAGAQGYVHAARAALCSPSVALLHDDADCRTLGVQSDACVVWGPHLKRIGSFCMDSVQLFAVRMATRVDTLILSFCIPLSFYLTLSS